MTASAPEDPAPRILNESESYLSVLKPSGWHTLKGRSKTACLQSWLEERATRLKEIPDGGILYRLDEVTSGLILVARNREVYEESARDFRESDAGKISARKFYLALVEGNVEDGSFEFEFFSRYKSSKKISVREVSAHADPRQVGRCRWRRLWHDDRENSQASLSSEAREKFRREPSLKTRMSSEARKWISQSLIEVELLGGGKRHQIRAGLAHLGHPILGDSLYGATAAVRWDAPSQAGTVKAQVGGTATFGLHCSKIIYRGNEWAAPTPHWARL